MRYGFVPEFVAVAVVSDEVAATAGATTAPAWSLAA